MLAPRRRTSFSRLHRRLRQRALDRRHHLLENRGRRRRLGGGEWDLRRGYHGLA